MVEMPENLRLVTQRPCVTGLPERHRTGIKTSTISKPSTYSQLFNDKFLHHTK